MSDAHFMALAIEASRRALDAGDMPYGAALVAQDGALLHVAGNRQVTTADCTAHAEIVLVREAASRLGPAALRGSTVCASGEPCAMCSGALFWAGVRRVVYAASNEAMARVLGGGEVLPIRCVDVVGAASPPVQVDGPVEAEAALQVLLEAARRRGHAQPAASAAPR